MEEYDSDEIILDNLSDEKLEVLGEYHRRLRNEETELQKMAKLATVNPEEAIKEYADYTEKYVTEKNKDLAKSELNSCALYGIVSSVCIGAASCLYESVGTQILMYTIGGSAGLISILSGKLGLEHLAALSNKTS